MPSQTETAQVQTKEAAPRCWAGGKPECGSRGFNQKLARRTGQPQVQTNVESAQSRTKFPKPGKSTWETPPKEQKVKKLPSPILYGSKDDLPKKSIHDRVGTRNATRGTPETSIKDRLGVRPDSTRNQEGTRRYENPHPRRSQRYIPPTFQRGCSQFTAWEYDQDRYELPIQDKDSEELGNAKSSDQEEKKQ